MRVGTGRNENYVRRDLDKMADRKVGSCHPFLFYLFLFAIFNFYSKETTKEDEFMLQVLLYILFSFVFQDRIFLWTSGCPGPGSVD